MPVLCRFFIVRARRFQQTERLAVYAQIRAALFFFGADEIPRITRADHLFQLAAVADLVNDITQVARCDPEFVA